MEKGGVGGETEGKIRTLNFKIPSQKKKKIVLIRICSIEINTVKNYAHIYMPPLPLHTYIKNRLLINMYIRIYKKVYNCLYYL